MIAKPTTEQILNDCSRELMEVVLPAVTDETVPGDDLHDGPRAAQRGRARRPRDRVDDRRDRTSSRRSPAARPSSGTESSLHLDDVVERYRQASEAFSRAMEEAIAAGDEERTRRGAALMAHRVEREQEVMCGWSPVGRWHERRWTDVATALAHISVRPGMEASFERVAAELYRATHEGESAVRRYEYFRGSRAGDVLLPAVVRRLPRLPRPPVERPPRGRPARRCAS